MARRRGSRLSGPFSSPAGGRSGPIRTSVTMAGRSPWRSSYVQELLRPLPTLVIASRLRRAQLSLVRSRTDPRVMFSSFSPQNLSKRIASPLRLRSLAFTRPIMHGKQTPCVQRARRREYLFSTGVAGSSWRSRSGPSMRGARFSLSSSYTCR